MSELDVSAETSPTAESAADRDRAAAADPDPVHPAAGHPEAADPDAAEADALQDLGDEIATLAAHIHAATHRLLELIREFDRRRGWERAGFRSCAHWLAFRTGVRLGSARERVRTARALERLPETSRAMARGELSFAKVRALTRVATPESERELIEYARSTTAAGVERLVRGWRMLSAADEEERERRRHASRHFSIAPDLDGTYVVRGRLEPEVAAVLMRAVEAASDALYVSERNGGDGGDDGDGGAGAGSRGRSRGDPPNDRRSSRARTRARSSGRFATRAARRRAGGPTRSGSSPSGRSRRGSERAKGAPYP